MTKTFHRYDVLDQQNQVINTILVDYPIPVGYDPGYGWALTDKGPAPGSSDYVAPQAPPPSSSNPVEQIVNGTTEVVAGVGGLLGGILGGGH